MSQVPSTVALQVSTPPAPDTTMLLLDTLSSFENAPAMHDWKVALPASTPTPETLSADPIVENAVEGGAER